jgi:hypothetical protein
MKGTLTVVKINTDKYPGISSDHKVQVRQGKSLAAACMPRCCRGCLAAGGWRLACCPRSVAAPLVSSVALRAQGLPTLVMFKKGKEVARITGGLQAAQLRQWVSANM